MNTVISLLLVILYNSLNKDVYYDIALKILENINHIESLTASSLARQCYTSINTINKFCTLLGFQSFSNFKSNFISRINSRRIQLTHRISVTSKEQILKNINTLSCVDFNQQNFTDSIDKLIDIIHESNNIQVTGASFPVALSLNFQEDMIIMNKLAFSVQNEYIITPSKTKDGLLLLISITGSLFEYHPDYFKKLQKEYTHIAVICGQNGRQYLNDVECAIIMPIAEDDEMGNLLILEVLRYIKFCYYEKYFMEDNNVLI